MEDKNAVSRRKFVGGLAAALGYVSTGPNLDVFAQGRAAGQGRPGGRPTTADYDALAKLANNENNWGIPKSVMEAMEGAWKYAGRYGYPDPGINQAIAPSIAFGMPWLTWSWWGMYLRYTWSIPLRTLEGNSETDVAQRRELTLRERMLVRCSYEPFGFFIVTLLAHVWILAIVIALN